MEKQSEEGKQKELDREASQNEQIRETGQAVLDGNSRKHKVELLTVIGEIEGHESAPSHSKTTKYEHVLPKLALIEDDEEIEGLLILLNTVGGDVEAGLAIAEMIASLSIPTVSLVLGGCRAARVRPRPLRRGADHRGQIIPLSCQVLPWWSIRYARTECSSAWRSPTAIWKRSRTGSLPLYPDIHISRQNGWRS